MKELHNIFSNKKMREDKKEIEIIVDIREKQSLVPSFLVELGATINFKTLDIGDYIISNTIIERKTCSDLVASLIDKRLKSQLHHLKKFPKCFLLIEGFNYEYDKYHMHENALRGLFLSLITDYNIPVIFSKDSEDTAKFLLLYAKKKSNPMDSSLRPFKSIKTLEEQKQFILEGFPGIGPSLSKRLLDRYKTLKDAFNANSEDLSSIDRMDAHTIKSFKELLES